MHPITGKYWDSSGIHGVLLQVCWCMSHQNSECCGSSPQIIADLKVMGKNTGELQNFLAEFWDSWPLEARKVFMLDAKNFGCRKDMSSPSCSLARMGSR